MVSGTKYTGLKTRLKQIKIQTWNEELSLGKQYYIFVRSILYIDRLVHMIWLESHILNCTGRLFKSVDWCISQMVVICWAFLLHNSWYFFWFSSWGLKAFQSYFLTNQCIKFSCSGSKHNCLEPATDNICHTLFSLLNILIETLTVH